MRHRIHRPRLALLALGCLLSITSCNDDDTMSGAPTVQPATVEALFVEKADDIAGFGDALSRVLLDLAGSPQPGVAFTPTATGGSFVVGVDKDGDGSYELDVIGSLEFLDPGLGIVGGGVLTITNLTGNAVNFTATVAPVGATSALFDDIVAVVPAESDRPQVTVSAGAITVDASTSPPVLSGFADFTVGDLPATMTLTDNGGNPSILVTGADFSFTVP